VVPSGRRRPWRVASYELAVRVANDNAVLFIDLQQSLIDDTVKVTLVEVTGGHVQATFVARKMAFWDIADNGEKVVLRSDGMMNVADADWHRIEIIRYRLNIILQLVVWFFWDMMYIVRNWYITT